jgi:hypothetical protein
MLGSHFGPLSSQVGLPTASIGQVKPLTHLFSPTLKADIASDGDIQISMSSHLRRSLIVEKSFKGTSLTENSCTDSKLSGMSPFIVIFIAFLTSLTALTLLA